MSNLRVGMRVTSTTHHNRDGSGLGKIIGVEVSDRERPGHLRHELDPVKVDQLLIDLEESDDYWPRIVVDCFDKDGAIKHLHGSTILCFYKSDHIKPFWVTLSNGEEYCFQTEINGIEYWLPNDETLTIRLKYGALEQDTDFYEMDDFMHEDSDYRYVVHQGELMCRFEAEDLDRRSELPTPIEKWQQQRDAGIPFPDINGQ